MRVNRECLVQKFTSQIWCIDIFFLSLNLIQIYIFFRLVALTEKKKFEANLNVNRRRPLFFKLFSYLSYGPQSEQSLRAAGADPGFSFRGAQHMCLHAHIMSAEPNSLSSGVQGPLKGPRSCRVVLMLSRALWALFLSFLIKFWIKKESLSNFFFLGGACLLQPPPPPPPLDPPLSSVQTVQFYGCDLVA